MGSRAACNYIMCNIFEKIKFLIMYEIREGGGWTLIKIVEGSMSMYISDTK